VNVERPKAASLRAYPAGGLAALIAGIAIPFRRLRPRLLAAAAAATIAGPLALAPAAPAYAQQSVVDEEARAALLKRPNGRLAQLKTKYNEILIDKRRHQLTMLFRVKGWEYVQSATDLRDPDVLPVAYTRNLPVGLAYPETPRKILMIGLGGGSVSTYLGRAMPELTIDAIDIDPGIIEVAKKYFGIRETPRIHYIVAAGRAFLEKSSETYDLIVHDAYDGGGVPSRLLTREFYELMRQRLSPGGVIAYNVHDATQLYLPTLKTLSSVFSSVHLYPSGVGEVIVVATANEAPDDGVLKARAAALQERHKFRYPLPQILARRTKLPSLDKAHILTDEQTLGGAPAAVPVKKP
jgi:spermidine synthase